MVTPLNKRLPFAIFSAIALCGLSGLSGCVTHSEAEAPTASLLDEKGVANKIPAHIKDKEGWADDILSALRLLDKEPTAERVCAIIAVIQQESGFQKDPAVNNLPKIVRDGLEEKFSKLGPLAGPAVTALLSGSPPGSNETFAKRIDKLKTERDLDRMFRDLEAAYREKLPGTFAVASAISYLLGKGTLRDLNPVTTAGSMQVKVSFAKESAENEKLADGDVREILYTRAGGIRYGAKRLLDYPASYNDVIYRFADYNAGVYASRNAAFQDQLGEIMHKRLVEDGDLLAYSADGSVKDYESESLKTLLAFSDRQDYSNWVAKRDARKEKSVDFEETTSWKEVKAVWEKQNGKLPPYAKIPNVQLNSPKLQKTRSTEWFAKSVNHHYQSCRARK